MENELYFRFYVNKYRFWLLNMINLISRILCSIQTWRMSTYSYGAKPALIRSTFNLGHHFLNYGEVFWLVLVLKIKVILLNQDLIGLNILVVNSMCVVCVEFERNV